MLKKTVLAVAVIAVLVVGYALVSPIFTTVRLDEAAPSGADRAPSSFQASDSDYRARPYRAAALEPAPIPEPSPILAAAPAPAIAPVPTAVPTQEPEARVSVIGTASHPASGTVRIVEADGRTYVRYEDFKTINGPDIFVYLANDLDASDFVNLGRVRATEGNVNYEVPADVSLEDYPYVVTWCRAFGVLFNYADLRAR